MLVESMNYKEITTEVVREFEKLLATTIQRLQKEYTRERRKLKISKERIYARLYCVKTAGKNNWIIYLGKPPYKNKFHESDIDVFAVVYYYNKKGLRVFCPDGDDHLVVYNGHFFKRYNERLNLNLSNSVDVLKHFVKNDLYVKVNWVDKEKNKGLVGFCKDGILLGEMIYNDMWILWRTFISRDLARKDQHHFERGLIMASQKEVCDEVEKQVVDIEMVTSEINKILAITGQTID